MNSSNFFSVPSISGSKRKAADMNNAQTPPTNESPNQIPHPESIAAPQIKRVRVDSGLSESTVSSRHLVRWLPNAEFYLKLPREEFIPGLLSSTNVLVFYKGDMMDCPFFPADLLNIRSFEPVERLRNYMKYCSLAATFIQEKDSDDAEWLWDELVHRSLKIRRQEANWYLSRRNDGTLHQAIAAQQEGFLFDDMSVVFSAPKDNVLLSFNGDAVDNFREIFKHAATPVVCETGLPDEPIIIDDPVPSITPPASQSTIPSMGTSQPVVISLLDDDDSETHPPIPQQPRKIFPKSQSEIELEEAWSDSAKRQKLQKQALSVASASRTGQVGRDKYSWMLEGRKQLGVQPPFSTDPVDYRHETEKGMYMCAHQRGSTRNSCMKAKCQHVCCKTGVSKQTIKDWIFQQQIEFKRLNPTYQIRRSAVERPQERGEGGRQAKAIAQEHHPASQKSPRGRDKADAFGKEPVPAPKPPSLPPPSQILSPDTVVDESDKDSLFDESEDDSDKNSLFDESEDESPGTTMELEIVNPDEDEGDELPDDLVFDILHGNEDEDESDDESPGTTMELEIVNPDEDEGDELPDDLVFDILHGNEDEDESDDESPGTTMELEIVNPDEDEGDELPEELVFDILHSKEDKDDELPEELIFDLLHGTEDEDKEVEAGNKANSIVDDEESEESEEE